jgi:hypothetical protein
MPHTQKQTLANSMENSQRIDISFSKQLTNPIREWDVLRDLVHSWRGQADTNRLKLFSEISHLLKQPKTLFLEVAFDLMCFPLADQHFLILAQPNPNIHSNFPTQIYSHNFPYILKYALACIGIRC